MQSSLELRVRKLRIPLQAQIGGPLFSDLCSSFSESVRPLKGPRPPERHGKRGLGEHRKMHPGGISRGPQGAAGLDGAGFTHRLLSSSFLGVPYRFRNMTHKKELLWAYG